MTRRRCRGADLRRTAAKLGPETYRGPGRRARLLAVAPVMALFALLCLIFLSWTGWGVETQPADQLLRDAPWLVLAAITGAGGGAVFARALTETRGRAMAVGAVLGTLPVMIRVTAYFTDLY